MKKKNSLLPPYVGKKSFLPVVCFLPTCLPYQSHRTLHSVHQLCGGFSPQHQLSVLQSNLILTPSTWTQHQIPQVKGSVPQDCPSHHISDANCQQIPGYPQLLPDLDTNQRFQRPPSTSLINSLEFKETHSSVY